MFTDEVKKLSKIEASILMLKIEKKIEIRKRGKSKLTDKITHKKYMCS